MAYVRTRNDGALGEVYVPEEEDDPPPAPPAAPPAGVNGGPLGFSYGLGAPFGATVSVPGGVDGPACSADERRVHPIVVAQPSALAVAAPQHRHYPSRRNLVEPAAYAAYTRMKAAAEQAGLAPSLLTIISGFRTVAEQQDLWNKALARYGTPGEARKWVAPPGGSVHQTGRALDLWLGHGIGSGRVASLRRTPAYHWMVCNAARFGFFPYAREPWHWEFNPPRLTPGLQGPRGFGHGFGFAEPPPPPAAGPLAPIARLTAPHTAATEANAFTIVRALSAFHNIPCIVPYVVLEHEGGVALINHNDGVMQTIAGARTSTAPRIPRAVKLAVLGRPPADPITNAALDAAVLAAFPGRLAVQIAFGVQELMSNLGAVNNFLALALIGYNAGTGNAIRAATNGASMTKPPHLTAVQWERRCQFGASLYHRFPASLTIGTGLWQCDRNMGPHGWFKSIPVQVPGGIQLVAYQYLRSIRECVRKNRPTLPCDAAHHGASHRQAGTGPIECKTSRPGALDKIYDPCLLPVAYRKAATPFLKAIVEDEQPIKCDGPNLVKFPILAAFPL